MGRERSASSHTDRKWYCLDLNPGPQADCGKQGMLGVQTLLPSLLLSTWLNHLSLLLQDVVQQDLELLCHVQEAVRSLSQGHLNSWGEGQMNE